METNMCHRSEGVGCGGTRVCVEEGRCRDGGPEKIHAMRELQSGILGQVSDAEIADLERDTPKVSEYNENEEEMEGFDPSLSLKNKLTKVSEQIFFFKKEEGLFRCFLNIRTSKTISTDFLIKVLS